MNNEEKYRSAEDRAKAFLEGYLDGETNSLIVATIALDFAYWLSRDVSEEEPENCPFCGNKVLVTNGSPSLVQCSVCDYSSKACKTRDEAIDAHNRVARAVRAAKKSEEK